MDLALTCRGSPAQVVSTSRLTKQHCRARAGPQSRKRSAAEKTTKFWSRSRRATRHDCKKRGGKNSPSSRSLAPVGSLENQRPKMAKRPAPMFISHSPEETFGAGTECAGDVARGDVFALTGDLGAGKTQ